MYSKLSGVYWKTFGNRQSMIFDKLQFFTIRTILLQHFPDLKTLANACMNSLLPMLHEILPAHAHASNPN